VTAPDLLATWPSRHASCATPSLTDRRFTTPHTVGISRHPLVLSPALVGASVPPARSRSRLPTRSAMLLHQRLRAVQRLAALSPARPRRAGPWRRGPPRVTRRAPAPPGRSATPSAPSGW